MTVHPSNNYSESCEISQKKDIAYLSIPIPTEHGTDYLR